MADILCCVSTEEQEACVVWPHLSNADTCLPRKVLYGQVKGGGVVGKLGKVMERLLGV